MGFDLDGVIFDTIPEYIKVCNKLARTEHTEKDLASYDFSEMPGWNPEIAHAAYNTVAINQNYPLAKFVKTLLFDIKSREDFNPHIYFISSRIPMLHWVTYKKLEACVNRPWSLHTGYRHHTKWIAIQGFGIDYFVEDSLEEAKSITEQTDCLVFLVDKLYNRGDVSPGILRIQDLRDVGFYLGMLRKENREFAKFEIFNKKGK